MKYTKLGAIIALAASLQTFSQYTINLTIVNISNAPIGISVEGTTDGTAKGPQKLFGNAVIKPNSQQIISLRNISPDYFIKQKGIEKYKLKMARLAQGEHFDPSTRINYTQKKMMQNKDAMFVIPPMGKAVRITRQPTIGLDLREYGTGHQEGKTELGVEFFG